MYIYSRQVVQKCIDNYKAPTPKIWRNIGDACVILGSFLTGILVHYDLPFIVTDITAGLSCIGKILTNFTKE